MPDPTDLLHNVSARVRQVGPGRLRCEVTGRLVTSLLIAGGLVALALGSGSLVAAFSLPFPDPRPLMLCGVVALLGGLLLLGMAWSRSRKGGIYLLDRETRTITRLVGESERERWRFDQIHSIEHIVDITDGTRLDLLPRLPAWLVLVSSDGRRLRVAKGGEAELARVRRALEELGLKADPPVP